MILLLVISRPLWVFLVVVVAAVGVAFGLSIPRSTSKAASETIYIVNQDPHAISNRTILKDIPAWETAANRDFRPAWDSPVVRIKLVSQAPAGAITAVFKNDGPVQGALAYHTVENGAPRIIVYAGVGDFYGYNNSVSFTHELFELLADQNINSWNWHWQSDPIAYYVGREPVRLPQGAFWFNEVCDPVEAYSYSIAGVRISDFVTPNWFGDQVNGGFDHMNQVHEPLQTLRGGYSQFVADNQYRLVQFFRHAGRDAAGFLKGEKAEISAEVSGLR